MIVASIYSYLPIELTAALLALAAVLGAVLGSFICCVAGRLVAGESPWQGRSHCDSCGHTLGALDLVPVLSWLALRGRCRHCGAALGARPLAAELTLAAAFAALTLHFGPTPQALGFCALATILLGVTLVDLDTLTIPNGFIVASLLAWLVMCALIWVANGAPAARATALSGAAGAAALGAGVAAVGAVMRAALGRAALGGGDVKLLAVCGLYLGIPTGILTLIVACILGLAFSICPRKQSVSESANPAATASAPSPAGVLAADTADTDTPAAAPAIHGTCPRRRFPRCIAVMTRFLKPPTLPLRVFQKLKTAHLGLADSPALRAVTAGPSASPRSASLAPAPADAPAAATPTGAFPFGPAIAAATILCVIFGNPITSWYLSLL